MSNIAKLPQLQPTPTPTPQPGRGRPATKTQYERAHYSKDAFEMEPPSDLLAERAVIGSIFRAGRCLDEVSDILQPDDFYDRRLRAIYRAMIELRERKERHDDPALINAQLRADKAAGQEIGFEDLGDETGDYLPELMAVLRVSPDSLHARGYAQQIVRKAQARDLINVMLSVCADAAAPGIVDIDTLCDDLAESAVAVKHHREGMIKPELSPTQIALIAPYQSVIQSGFPDLDRMVRAQRGDLIILAAETARGKSSLAMNMAIEAARAGARADPVAIVSLELTREMIIQRAIASLAVVPFADSYTRDEEDRRLAAGELLTTMRSLIVRHIPFAGLGHVLGAGRALKQRLHGLDLLIVDYLQLLREEPTDKGKTRAQLLGDATASLRQLAGDLDCVVLCLSQLNREISRREKAIPRLSDLRDSGAIEQSASQVVFLYQDPQKQGGIMTVEVAKNSNGPLGICDLRYSPSCFTFSPMETPTR